MAHDENIRDDLIQDRGGVVSRLVTGPVEAFNVEEHTATVLGQKVRVSPSATLAVGLTATVYASTDANETLLAEAVRADGQYAAGSTVVFISGIIQKISPNVGRIIVSGLTVDLTATMWNGIVWPSVGSRVEVC